MRSSGKICQHPDPLADEQAAPAADIATADQEDFWLASELGLAPAASHIVRVMGVRGRALEPEAWQAAWTRLTDRHAALRTVFYSDGDGPLLWRTVESR